MKKLLFLLLPLLLVLSTIRGQTITNTSAVPHTTGTPSGAPSTYGSWIRFDKTSKILYRWTGSAWTAGIGTGVGGIYSGSGTVPGTTTATVAGGLRFNTGSTGQLLFGDYGFAGSGGSLNIQSSGTVLSAGAYGFRAQADDLYTQMVSPGYTVRLEPTTAYTLIQSTATNGYKFWDTRATPRGVEYSADYSATYNDRSLMDFGSVKALVSDSLAGGGGGSTPTLQQVTDEGASTTNSITAGASIALSDPNNLSIVGTGTTDDRTYTLPDRSGTIRVGENYKVYTALLSQSGTDAPTATVLENTLGGTVVWSRFSGGVFDATLTGAFTSDKTFVLINRTSADGNVRVFSAFRNSADVVRYEVLDEGGNSIDGVSVCIEIRVYP